METVFAGPVLEQFRRNELAGDALLGRLAAAGGKMLVSASVGVGKSRAIDNVVEAAVRGVVYDLVLVFCPTRQVLNERRWVQDPAPDVDVRVLEPRPSQRCGALDTMWRQHEQRGLGQLGRATLCAGCPRRQGCPWPQQYGSGLHGASVIFATQSHLERDPSFIATIERWTAAKRALTLIDENGLMLASFERKITAPDLHQFRSVMDRLHVGDCSWADIHNTWRQTVQCLQHATDADLVASTWKIPHVDPKWALRVQEHGYDTYGADFRFLAYDLVAFGRAGAATRERLDDGALRFTSRPKIETDAIVFSGTCNPTFAQYRLNLTLADPFGQLRFTHADTRWYNIASPLGAHRYFEHNSPQIVDFYAELITRRHQEGKRCRLVAKKDLVSTCADDLNRRFADRKAPLRVVGDGWTPDVLGRPEVVPLIHFGVIGTNLFEDFDAAYCLNSYNVHEGVINQVLQDLSRSDGRVPLRIEYDRTRPRRRRVVVENFMHRHCDVAAVANMALQHQEMDVVLQAVGRVRPFTKPREIILFQCGSHPQVEYAAEFETLGEARAHFGILPLRERAAEAIRQRVAAGRAAGQRQQQVADATDIPLRTVQRYWKPATKPFSE